MLWFESGNLQALIPSQIDGISFLKAAFRGPRDKGVGCAQGIWALGACCNMHGWTGQWA